MIKYKNQEQIKTIAEGGKILSKIMDLTEKKIKSGLTGAELNDYTEKLIEASGGEASFKNYKAAWTERVYPSALCISINNQVVHGIPDNYKFKDGDIVGLDCGLKYKGLYTDMARTVAIGKISPEAKKLMSVTKECLMAGIKKAKVGSKLSDISKTIQQIAERNKFSVVKQLCGHGVGFSAHEDPQIPNYWPAPGIKDITLESGMVLAIEPMINTGTWEVATLDDDWTIVTVDNSLSAHFEHTIAITDQGPIILTK
jgi:methionyl aminopeptidase